MTYTIYADTLPEVTKRLDRIAAKAQKYNIPFAYTIGEAHKQTVTVYERDEYTEKAVGSYDVAAIDIDVECDGFIKADGWTVKAKVEHGEDGNIVTSFDGDIDSKWFACKPHCDHCNTNRFRTVTYMCEKNGTVKQVGKGCLKDYTGINPALAAMWAEVRDIFPQGIGSSYDPDKVKEFRVFDVRTVLAAAADSIKAYGYIKSSDAGSTKTDVLKRIDGCAVYGKSNGTKPSDDGYKTADKVLAWLAERKAKAEAIDASLEGLDYEAYDPDCDYLVAYRELSRKGEMVADIERNAANIAAVGYVKPSQVGLLVYMPIACEKFAEKMARREAKDAAAKLSKYVGEVGDRLTITAKTAQLVTSWESQYGWTYLYRFVDADGNVFVWFASRTIDIADGMTVKGTVKNHNERNNEKQTVLTRCKTA